MKGRRIISEMPRRCNENACFHCLLSDNRDRFVSPGKVNDSAEITGSGAPLSPGQVNDSAETFGSNASLNPGEVNDSAETIGLNAPLQLR